MKGPALVLVGLAVLAILVAVLWIVLRRSPGSGANSTTGRTAPASAASDELVQILAPIARRTYDPVVEEEDAAGPVSKFGGAPWMPEDSAWPVCPHCEQPMQFFVQLDVASLPEDVGVRGEGLIQMFMCLGEEGDERCWSTYEAYSEAESLHLVDSTLPGSNAPTDDDHPTWPARRIVDWEGHEDLPDFEDLEAAGFELDERTAQLYETAWEEDGPPGPVVGDKLGGWPYWIQSPAWGTCRECGATMRLVLQIDSEDNVPFLFGDMGNGHICQCPDHPHVLTWGWACY